jgi:phosphoribosyl-ATP pyrophosphohydrolase
VPRRRKPTRESAPSGCDALPNPLPSRGVAAADDIFSRLMALLEQRKSSTAEKSYTASLFAGGVQRIGEKIAEEAGETVAAASEPGEDGRRHLVHEAADLIYHLFVLMAHRDVSLAEVEAELARRFGTSGHDEKGARKK